VDVSGVVNNGPLSIALFNNNNIFTEGFNLVGNPYPSAIDWNAAGWTKTYIDNAVYYFQASTTDSYGGTYSSYIDGVSTDPGVATNIIPSMQGFFVHVSDGTFPVAGTLGLDNSVRINNQAHAFLKSAEATDRLLISATASFTDDTNSSDPTVICFINGSQTEFDSGFDALKLINTDMLVANFYSVLAGGARLSINSLPDQTDTALIVPMGLRTFRDGEVSFKIKDVENPPPGLKVYFRDKLTGANANMLLNKDYRVSLPAGEYNDRFYFAFLKSITGINDPEASSVIFTAYASAGIIKATVNTLAGKYGVITVYDLNGRPLYVKKVYETGFLEFDPGIRQGIYIISFVTGNYGSSIKLALGF
ncbi:MAG: hypothetical protein IH593_13720, partial [Bacteroidales bacterium]|nr:hypothetical protein [Bacteroidales bacterium]